MARRGELALIMGSILNKPEAAEEATDGVAIPVVEETATIGKREAVTQRVRVSTKIEETEQVFEDLFNREEVEIERVAVGRVVETMPEIRTQGDILIVPVVEERAVVSKQLVLVEEVHIHKRSERQPARIPVKLRRHRIEIEDQTPSSREPYPPPKPDRSK